MAGFLGFAGTISPSTAVTQPAIAARSGDNGYKCGKPAEKSCAHCYWKWCSDGCFQDAGYHVCYKQCSGCKRYQHQTGTMWERSHCWKPFCTQSCQDYYHPPK